MAVIKGKKTEAPAKEATSSSVDDIFAQLIGQHNKITPGISTSGAKMESEVKFWIDSGSLLLNMTLSNKPDGGWPSGRIIEVFGKESIGKSTLSYVAMANCQKMGGLAIYGDIERAGNKKFMQMLGINLNELIITNEDTIEKLFQGIENNLKYLIENKIRRDKPVLIVVDSVTALQTDAEEASGYEYNMNIQMKKAMMLGKALKKITPYLNKANACLFLVNQIRDNTTGYGDSYVVPGGKSIPFYASIRLYLQGQEKIVAKDPTVENEFQEALAAWKKTKIGEKPVRAKIDEVAIGTEITSYTKKNKVSPPFRTAQFRIIFNKGLFDIECYLTYALRYGFVKQAAAWCNFVHPEILKQVDGEIPKFYATGWLDILTKYPKVYAKLEELITEKLTIKMDSETELSIDKEEMSDEEEYNVNIPKEDFEEEED